jgi:peptidoglycan/xylan/chitin deacetylase (PgdA/CDA1 family)
MINVYWGTEYLDDMLDIFDEYDVTTTFFVGGQWVEKESEMLMKIIDAGHEIGNHGYFHKEHEYLDYNQNYDEINVNHNLVKVLTNVEMNLFAPPSGSFNKSTLQAAKNLGYQTIMWTKDTIDWRDHDTNLIFSRATNKISGGDLILAHPTEMTIKALPLILEYYKINNLKVTTVSECLK